MALRIGINGLGRIGRCILRAVAETGRKDIQVVAINGPAPVETHVHLLRYDSIHGRFNGEVKFTGDEIDMGFGPMALFHERDPKLIPWGEYGVDLVLECSGKFTKKEDAAQHLENASVKRILISAPATNADATIVYGVNNETLRPEHQVISVGSCTTNCLAPVAKALNDAVGIESGFMTTIHAYTGDQNIVDGSHKDIRRARAAALSMIPTSTGAAKALGLVLPELAGKLDGTSIRVPTPNVSLVDLTFTAKKDTRKEELHAAIEKAVSGSMKGVLGATSVPLVSIDFNHSPFSAVFDYTGTHVMNKRLCRVAAWYDNEWAFSLRMLDVAALCSKL